MLRNVTFVEGRAGRLEGVFEVDEGLSGLGHRTAGDQLHGVLVQPQDPGAVQSVARLHRLAANTTPTSVPNVVNR